MRFFLVAALALCGACGTWGFLVAPPRCRAERPGGSALRSSVEDAGSGDEAFGQLREEDISEVYTKGSGSGGQKINKVRNCVVLTHEPTGISVRCQETRSLSQNRERARDMLREKLDKYYNGKESKSGQKVARKKKNKARKKARAKKKYNSAAASGGGAQGRFDDDFFFDDFAAPTDGAAGDDDPWP